MSYQFYTSTKDEDKLKEHILKKLHDAGAPVEGYSPSAIMAKRLAGSAAEAVLKAQKIDLSKASDPAKAFAIEVRRELNQNNATLLSTIAAGLSSDLKINLSAQDLLSTMTGVDPNGQPKSIALGDKKVASFYDDLKVGAPEPKAIAPVAPPPAQATAGKAPDKAAAAQTPAANAKAAKTPKAAAPAASAANAPAAANGKPAVSKPEANTPPAQAITPKNEFEAKYIGMQAIAAEAITNAFKSVEEKDATKAQKLKDEAVAIVSGTISEALKPELGVQFDDKDLQAVAEVTGSTIVNHIQKLKQTNPNQKFTTTEALQQDADTLGAEIRDALAQANKDKKLGKLSDGMLVSYADILTGVNAEHSVTQRHGTNFHTLGATMLAQAFGSEDVQENQKRDVAKALVKHNFQAQGGTLDHASVDGTIDTVLTGYNPATISAVKDITKQAYEQKSSFDDTKKAWDSVAEEEKGGFFDVIKRFLMFVDALIESYTGFSIVNSIMGPGSNPIIERAKEMGEHRHIKDTYQAIMEASPESLGLSPLDVDKSARRQLAEKVTGIGQDEQGNFRPVNVNGNMTGLIAVASGLDANGHMAGMDVSVVTPSGQGNAAGQQPAAPENPVNQAALEAGRKARGAGASAGQDTYTSTVNAGIQSGLSKHQAIDAAAAIHTPKNAARAVH